MEASTNRAYVAQAETAAAYWMIGVLWRVLATGVLTGGSLCLLDQRCSPGSGPPRHSHPQDEGLYVVKGEMSFSAGGNAFRAGPGSLVSVPRHTEHSFVVEGEEALLINFYFPAGFEVWLMGSAAPALRNETPPPDTTAPPEALTKRLSDDYGGLPLTQERSTSPNPYAAALPAIASRSTAETWGLDGACWTILADGDSTGGDHSVFEVQADGGLVEAPHRNTSADVACYVLEGELDVLIDDQVHQLAAGGLAFFPRPCVRSLRVRSPGSRWLSLHARPGFERWIRARGSRMTATARPPGRLAQIAMTEQERGLRDDLGIQMIEIPAMFAEVHRVGGDA